MDIVIKNYSDEYLESLNCLLKEVYDIEKKPNTTDNIEIVALYQEEVVGYLMLQKVHDSIKNIYYFYVQYVCVKKEYRRNGIGKALFTHVFELSLKNHISYIELTSNPMRTEAHFLYHSLGFHTRSTDVFRKEIL